jgi:hypothetical protein
LRQPRRNATRIQLLRKDHAAAAFGDSPRLMGSH